MTPGRSTPFSFGAILRQSSILWTSRLITALLGLVCLSLTARGLTLEAFGFLALIQAYVTLIGKLTTFTTWKPLIKYGSDAMAAGRPADFKALMLLGGWLELAAAVAGTVIAVAGAHGLAYLRGWDGDALGMTIVYSFVLLFRCVGVPTAVLRMRNRFDLVAAEEVLAVIVRLACLIAAWRLGAGLWVYVWIWAGTETLDAILQMLMGWWLLHREGCMRPDAAPLRELKTRYPGLWSFIWLSNFNSTFRQALSKLDYFAVDWLLGNAGTASFKIVKSIGNILENFSNPLQQVLYPHMAEAAAREKNEPLRDMSSQYARLLGAGGMAVLAVFFLAGPVALQWLFNEKYANVYWPCLIFLAGEVIRLAMLPVSLLLLCKARHKALFWLNQSTILLYLGGVYLGVLAGGLTGAALANPAGHAAFWLAASLYVHRHRRALFGEADRGRRPAPATVPGLSTAFFTRLNLENIRYVLWKSNEHLHPALCGDTDLDLLVAAADQPRLEAVARDMGFKRMESPPPHYPGMAHFLGFDAPTGRLLHVHVYSRLILGQSALKNHHLPVEEWLLAGARQQEGAAVPEREKELLLLLIRAHLKLGFTDLAWARRRSGSALFPEAMTREFHFLLAEFQEARFLEALRASALPLDAAVLCRALREIRENAVRPATVRRTRRHLFDALAPYRLQGFFRHAARRAGFALRHWRGVRRFLPVRRKTLPSGGRVFALVGADGAGKSSLQRDLAQWLCWKLQARSCYFGIPKTLAFGLLDAAALIAASLAGRAPGEMARRSLQTASRWISARRWLKLARHRLALSRSARRLAAGGQIVLADRFPLPELFAMEEPMDGPRIRKESPGEWRRLAEVEEQCYRNLEAPDHVFVLQVPLEELQRRKAEVLESRHREKAQAILAIPAAGNVSLIDANRPYEDVLLDLKRRVWTLV